MEVDLGPHRPERQDFHFLLHTSHVAQLDREGWVRPLLSRREDAESREAERPVPGWSTLVSSALGRGRMQGTPTPTSLWPSPQGEAGRRKRRVISEEL